MKERRAPFNQTFPKFARQLSSLYLHHKNFFHKMTWSTWATDGERIGSLDYLGEYWQEEWKIARGEKTLYASVPAKIKTLHRNLQADGWVTYTIESDIGTAQFSLRESLDSFVSRFLDPQNKRGLPEIAVTAYYQDRTLKAIGPSKQ